MVCLGKCALAADLTYFTTALKLSVTLPFVELYKLGVGVVVSGISLVRWIRRGISFRYKISAKTNFLLVDLSSGQAHGCSLVALNLRHDPEFCP
jgi:hypothetical protein